MQNDEIYSTLGPICPHCRHEHQADGPEFYDEDMDKFRCNSCEAEFKVFYHRTDSWTTSALLSGSEA